MQDVTFYDGFADGVQVAKNYFEKLEALQTQHAQCKINARNSFNVCTYLDTLVDHVSEGRQGKKGPRFTDANVNVLRAGDITVFLALSFRIRNFF